MQKNMHIGVTHLPPGYAGTPSLKLAGKYTYFKNLPQHLPGNLPKPAHFSDQILKTWSPDWYENHESLLKIMSFELSEKIMCLKKSFSAKLASAQNLPGPWKF